MIGRVAVLVGLLALGPGAAVASAAASYHSPHYKGLTQRPVAVAKPLPPVTLGTGKDPALLVDPAGTAHIAFSTDGGSTSADTIMYCRLPRGQNACAAMNSFAPTAPPGGSDDEFESNFPGGNHDFDGPVPLVVANQLEVVDRRFPDTFDIPGGGTSESNVFLWTSNDGGQTFTGGAQIGNNEIGGGAIIYGGAATAIGTISRTQTAGTTFQGAGAGQYTAEQALLGPSPQDYDGSLAVDGTLPVAAFDDTAGNTVVREWSGVGDVDDASTWSTATFSGFEPRLTGGPGGVFVMYRDSSVGGNVLVRRITAGQPTGAAVTVLSAASAAGISDPQISEDAAGHLVLGWIAAAGVDTATSSDGTTWSTPQLIAATPAGGSISSLALAATSDDGGFATYVENGTGAENVGTVVASAFGDQQGTGQPGVDGAAGGGIGTALGDQLATATCSDITFGAVQAVSKIGCFLPDTTDKTGQRLVSLGTVDINGIYLVPDTGAQIVIDPRQHTIDTVGSVSVVLRAPGISDITLWHGSLDVKLPTAAVGDTLFDLTSLTGVSVLEGFPIGGDIDVKLTNGGVSIPISLTLPGVFGGVSGAVTLAASLQGDLQLTTLKFMVPDVLLGVAELKNLDVMYTRTGDEWMGSAELDAPAGGKGFTLNIDLDFQHGQYHSGSIDATLPGPCGVPLDPDTPPAIWLQKVGLSVALGPVSITGRAGFGIICAGDEAADTGTVDASLNATFGNPVTFTAQAVGKLYGIQVQSGTLIYKVPDYVSFHGESGISIGPFSEEGTLDLLLDPANKRFAGSLTGGITIEGVSIPSYAVALSNEGFGVCVGPPNFFFPTQLTYHWGDLAPSIAVSLKGCPGVTAFGPTGSAARAPRAHAADGTTFSVPAGTQVIDLAVAGQGGAPSVVLTNPSGAQVVPSLGADHTAANAAAFPVDASATTYVGIVNPGPGTWTVSAADGSPPITGVSFAHPLPPTTVAVKLGGHGAKQRLAYVITGPPQATVRLLESGPTVSRVFATLHPGRGTLRFSPAAGPAGRRSILAQISVNNVPRTPTTVATFAAPGPPKLGRASKLKVTARGATFKVTWRPGAGAAMQLITVVGSDGRHTNELLPARTRALSLPVIGFADRLRVTVAAVGANGARGAAVAARGSGAATR